MKIYAKNRIDILDPDTLDFEHGHIISEYDEQNDEEYLIFIEETEFDRVQNELIKKIEVYDNYKADLAKSDYIIIKIQEASILGDTSLVNSLKSEYANKLTERISVRDSIHAIELEISALKERLETLPRPEPILPRPKITEKVEEEISEEPDVEEQSNE